MRASREAARALDEQLGLDGLSEPSETLEQRFTDGCTAALELDAECVRTLVQIRHLAADGEPGDSPRLQALAARLGEAQRELGELRGKLEQLRRRMDPGGERY